MLRILKTTSDGHTGHISVDCHIEEKSGNLTTKGAVETVGIHPDALQSKFGGDVKLWLQDEHRGIAARHEARKLAAKALEDLKEIKTLTLP
jgi:hypothetical protein